MEVSKGQCGTLVVRGKNQRTIDSGVVAWTGGVRFTTQKDGGYGLEHSFCSDWRCSRCLYLLMQLAHNLWQVYNACVLPKVAEGLPSSGGLRRLRASRRTDFRGSTVQMAQKRVRLESVGFPVVPSAMPKLMV